MSRLSRYIATALNNILAEASTAAGRNNGLNKLAFQLGQFVDNGISEEEAIAHCESFAARCGLPDREAAATIKSGLSKGMLHPRDLTHLLGLGCVTTTVQNSTEGPHVSALQPAARVPPAHLQQVLRSVWEEYLKDTPRDDQMRFIDAFVRTRRITQEDLWAAGVVEAESRRVGGAESRASSSNAADTVALGWFNEKGFSWIPRDAFGLLVPVWSDAWQEAPVGYRFRVLHSPMREHAKCYSMHGSADWRDTPLQHPGSLGRQGGTLVITEGEPDYLTLGKELVDRGCTVVGTPGAQWRTSWRYLLQGRERVVVAAHADEAGRAMGKKIRATCKDLKVPCTVQEPDVGDWSDARQRGVKLKVLVKVLIGGE